jgi:uncharacterized protein YjiS (DUF1127 family)
MTPSRESNDVVDADALDVASIVIHDHGRPAVFRVGAARNDARCDPGPHIVSEAPARTRHTLRATPLGFVASTNDATFDWASTYALYQAASARRGTALAALVGAVIRNAGGHLRVAWHRRQQRRNTRAIFNALSELDDRTLHDLGFHRCEILSVAAEAAGQAEPTRVRTALTPRTRSWKR